VTTSVYDGLIAEPPGQAKAILDRVTAALPSCHSYSKTAGGRTFTYTVSPLSLPASADQSLAVRLVTRVQRQTFQFDVVALRRGDVIALLGNGGLVLNEGTTQSVASAQAAKLGKLVG